ncbi:MAG TPA: thioredoxin domain-containing protein [Candidatus Polarisedimenticolaceae bacterium]|nr:thioredoxin domain-containing protein [Candidatus Polarisedimenticolaceae bacterium]
MSRLRPAVSKADHTAGPDDAPVTLVEYGDFECPHCMRAHPIVHELRRRMAGSLRFVFRHFPLEHSHPHARHAAEAAEAAAAHGKFWEMHDTLFAHQKHLEDEDLASYGTEVGIDPNEIRQALSAHTYASAVEEDFSSGARSGVNGTPTFFINGTRVDGPWDLQSLFDDLQEAMPARRR